MIQVMHIRKTLDSGGTENLLLELFNFPQNKIQFYLAIIKSGELVNRLNSKSNKNYVFNSDKVIDISVIFKLKKIIDSKNIKIVHSHQLIELVYAFILKILSPSIRIYHTIHGYGYRLELFEILERFLTKLTNGCFSVSNSSKEILLKKNYHTGMKVLYNAVNPEIKQDLERINDLKKKIRYNQDDIIIGMVGNFVWQKDQLTLIKAFNLLKTKYPNAKLLLIGKESSISESYKEFLYCNDLNNRIFFTGSLKKAKEVISVFDLFVMSTKFDTFGIAALEAIICGVPVIASDTSVLKEISGEEELFIFFKKENEKDLAIRIDYAIQNMKFLKKETLFKRILISEEFSYSKHISRLYSNYK